MNPTYQTTGGVVGRQLAVTNGLQDIPKKSSQVEDMLNLLRQKLGSQDDMIKHLNQRLQGVMSPSVPTPIKDTKSCTNCSVQLAASIENIAFIVEANNEELQNILQQLDL